MLIKYGTMYEILQLKVKSYDKSKKFNEIDKNDLSSNIS